MAFNHTNTDKWEQQRECPMDTEMDVVYIGRR
jgi:hypothetical protein